MRLLLIFDASLSGESIACARNIVNLSHSGKIRPAGESTTAADTVHAKEDK